MASVYSTNLSVGGATHALLLGLHLGESILAGRLALPLAVLVASTPSGWNGRVHPFLPTRFPRRAAPHRLGSLASQPRFPPSLVVSSLISGPLGPLRGLPPPPGAPCPDILFVLCRASGPYPRIPCGLSLMSSGRVTVYGQATCVVGGLAL